MKRKLTLLFGFGTGFLIAIAAIATGVPRYVTVCATNLSSVAITSCAESPSFILTGGIRPVKLPKGRLAPVGFVGEGTTSSGAPPSALREVTVDIDRHVALNNEGLPVCPRHRLEVLGSEAARKGCGPALVGTGTVEVVIDSSETIPGQLTLFNGGTRQGTTRLLIQADLPLLTPPIVAAMRITPISRGPYGLEAVLPIPQIDEGRGELTHFRLNVHRLFRDNGTKESYAMARCPKGSIVVGFNSRFAGGPRIVGGLDFPCTPVYPRGIGRS